MSDESVILINLLKAKSGKQGALIELLKQNTETVISTLGGWKTTRLIAAKDGAGVAIYSEWETPAAVEAMRGDPRMNANIAECSPTAAKSALQRGRAALRRLAQAPEDTRLPLMSDSDRRKITAYVHLFRSGDFDAIRAMLADDVKLDLVNRLQLEGRDKIGLYFTRYAEETKWRFALGAVEGQPAMLVFDSTGPMEGPSHFVLIDWSESRIIQVRDFLFAPYVLEAIDWVRLG